MLESNLIDRTKYKPMVKWTHATAILSKLVFCLLTVFTYGDKTRSIITNNLPKPIFRITVITSFHVCKAFSVIPHSGGVYTFSMGAFFTIKFYQGRRPDFNVSPRARCSLFCSWAFIFCSMWAREALSNQAAYRVHKLHTFWISIGPIL